MLGNGILGYTFDTGGSSLCLGGGSSLKVDASQSVCGGSEFEVAVDNVRYRQHGRLVSAAIVDGRKASMSLAKK